MQVNFSSAPLSRVKSIRDSGSMAPETFHLDSVSNISHLIDAVDGHSNLTSAEFIDAYDYDYDESTGHLPLDDLVPNALGYGLTLVLGLTGNILVIISVARYRRMHNVTNIFLLSLATADLLLVSTCVPVKFIKIPKRRLVLCQRSNFASPCVDSVIVSP
ncbi:Neuropeptide Y receptor type 1 [Bulinus truncatus]|nr:Neuropeptide Y receptor type 1 [Bulinus truncatus]